MGSCVSYIINGMPEEERRDGSLCLAKADQAILRAELQQEHNAQPSVQPQSFESLELRDLVYLTTLMACQMRETRKAHSV